MQQTIPRDIHGVRLTERTAEQRWSPELMALYRSDFDALVGVARRLLDRTGIAEEIVQEAFLRYHQHGVSPAPGSESRYLRAMVANAARSALRRRRTARHHLDSLHHDPTGAPVEDRVIASVDSADIIELIEALPQRQREVVRLRYLADFTERETAAALSLSRGSVKTHASRARRSLRTALAQAS